jgi:hypothetical protein
VARTSARVRWLVALAIVASSLAIRVVRRGPYFPGFDVVGASQGLTFVASEPASEYLRQYRAYRHRRHPAWNVVAAPAVLLPGALARLHPWEYWPHVVTFGLFCIALGLLARALELGADEIPLLLLGWASSAALMSYSVVGFAYITNTLPFAMALWVVLRRRHWLPTALLVALTIELAWNVQELGRTVFVVFIAAAFLLPAASWVSRATWLVGGCTQLYLSTTFHSFNTAHYASMDLPGARQSIETALGLGAHFLRQTPDLFLVIPLAAVTVWLTGPTRWFWIAVLGVQAGLLFVLAANSGTSQGIVSIWPRRILLLTFLGLATVMAALKQAVRGRPWIQGVLFAGALLQLAHTVAWGLRPLDARNREWDFTLPYAYTRLPNGAPLDSRVPFFPVDWYLEMRARVDEGARLLLLYNLSSFDENPTDPVAIPERLHLHVGHAAFVEQVFMFGERDVRWGKVPIRPIADFGSFLDRLERPHEILGYRLDHRHDARTDWAAARTHQREMGEMLRELERRFVIHWGDEDRSPTRTLRRFRLAPR